MKDLKFLQKWVLNSQIELCQDILDYEFFTYTHCNNLVQISFIHALYIEGHKHNSALYNGESYQKVPHDKAGLTITIFVGELNITVFWGNGCTVSVMPKSYFDQLTVFHKWKGISFWLYGYAHI